VSYQLWSWLLTFVGITGFIITGWLKLWWGWYINVFCQVLWILYAAFTQQWGFIASALIYTVIFGGSIYRHYRDNRLPPSMDEVNKKPVPYLYDGAKILSVDGSESLHNKVVIKNKEEDDGNDTAISAVDDPTERLLVPDAYANSDAHQRSLAQYRDRNLHESDHPGGHGTSARHRADDSTIYTKQTILFCICGHDTWWHELGHGGCSWRDCECEQFVFLTSRKR